ncbi:MULTISPECIES: hypothetical protein [Halorussus]|uniref:hypothetical protein n=1 Tax=Halorussus TaxID=1070314 RepID=UPI0013B37A05|nr:MULTISPECIES: hypothetical protein [Halorussus]NHN58118.1 hypothetical protein [Halorussus sp. JP-T4]
MIDSTVIGILGVIVGAGISEVGAHFRNKRQQEATDKRLATRQILENKRQVAEHILGRKVDILLDCYAEMEATHREVTRYLITIQEGEEYEHPQEIPEMYVDSLEAIRKANVFLPPSKSEELYNFIDEVRKSSIHIQNESNGSDSEYADKFQEDAFQEAYSEARKVIESELRGPLEHLEL